MTSQKSGPQLFWGPRNRPAGFRGVPVRGFPRRGLGDDLQLPLRGPGDAPAGGVRFVCDGKTGPARASPLSGGGGFFRGGREAEFWWAFKRLKPKGQPLARHSFLGGGSLILKGYVGNGFKGAANQGLSELGGLCALLAVLEGGAFSSSFHGSYSKDCVNLSHVARNKS